MRRLLMGFVWFVVLLNLAGLLVGAIVLGMIGIPYTDNTANYDAAHTVGETLGRQYGVPVFLVTLGLAVVGTLRGWYPGTRKAPKAPGGA